MKRTSICFFLFTLALALCLAQGCHRRVVPLPSAAPSGLGATGSGAVLDASNPFALKCGTIFCDARSTYCETIKTDVAALPSNYSCKPLPDSCRATSGQQAPTCTCFPPGTRGDFCSVVDRNGTPGFWRTTVGGR